MVTQTNSGFYLVHILTTGATASEGIPRDTCRLNIHLNTVVYQRGDKDRSKRCHTFTLRIVRRDTYQTVHPIFSFQITVGKIPFNIDRTGFDSGLITFLKVGNSSLIAICLSITQIHTHQHRSPILTLRTTGTGIDLQHTIHLVGLITKHILEFERFYRLTRFRISSIHIFLCYQFLFIEIKCQFKFICQRFDLIIAVNPLLQVFHQLHLGFSFLLVIPKSRSLRS